MADLTTTWLGLTLRSPLVVGASPVADHLDDLAAHVQSGAGAVILRSVFEEQLVAEQMAAHRFLDTHVDTDAEARSFLPESDVFSLGPEPALRHLQRVRSAVPVPVLASLNGVTPGGWTDMARQFADAGADAIELNLYEVVTSPEASSAEVEDRQVRVVEAVVGAVEVPVAVKLSAFYTALPAFVARLARAGARGVTVFNRFYQPGIDLETLDVDRHLVLSTSAELPLRLHALALLHACAEVDLGCTGGVHTGTDAAKAILCGAVTVQSASALLIGGPSAMARIRAELTGWLDEVGYADVSEARGAMSLDNVADPHAYERVNYTRMLQGWRPDDPTPPS